MDIDEELLGLLDAHTEARAEIVARSVALMERATGQVSSWYAPEAISAFTAQAGAIAGAGQRAVAAVTEGYLARTASLMLGEHVAAVPIAPEVGASLRVLPPGQGWDAVYQRVAATYRVAYAEHGNKDLAFYTANLRAQEMIDSDLGLAFQNQVSEFTRRMGRRGQRRYLMAFRRVLRPELSGGKVCGLCVAASTQIYYHGELLPLHPRCRCGVMLITPGSDPGDALNSDELAKLYELAGSSSYKDLRATKFEVKNHGELGPLLWTSGHAFTGQNP